MFIGQFEAFDDGRLRVGNLSEWSAVIPEKTGQGPEKGMTVGSKGAVEARFLALIQTSADQK